MYVCVCVWGGGGGGRREREGVAKSAKALQDRIDLKKILSGWEWGAGGEVLHFITESIISRSSFLVNILKFHCLPTRIAVDCNYEF